MTDPIVQWLDTIPGCVQGSALRLVRIARGLLRARDSWKRKAGEAWNAGYDAALQDVRQQFNWSDHMDEFNVRLQWLEAEGRHHG